MARRILLAEDTQASAVIMINVLQTAGHEVALVENGLEALQVAAGSRFDVILMDLNMPECGGLEATQRLRSEGGPNAHTPIIGLTGDDDSAAHKAALAAGMNAYIIKPVAPAELLRGIERTLRDAAKRSA